MDDDTLTEHLHRLQALAKELGRLDVTWPYNPTANVPFETLKILKGNGLRLSVVGREPATSDPFTMSRKDPERHARRVGTGGGAASEFKPIGISEPIMLVRSRMDPRSTANDSHLAYCKSRDPMSIS